MRTKSKLKMMRTDTDDGGADKKEKTTLLREITYLTRLIEQHDYKNKKASGLGMSLMESNVPRNKHVNIRQLNTSSTLYSSTSHKNKLNCTNIQTSSHHGLSLPASHSVFVNPKKLNRQLLEANSESIQKQNNFAAVDVPHRVYINPNFKKKESQTNKPVFKFVAGPVTSHITVGTTNKNICLNRGSEFGNKNIASQNIRNVLPTNINTNNPDMHRIRKSQEAPSNVNPGQLNKVFSYTKQSLSSSCLANISIDSHVNVVAQKPQILARKVVFQNSEAKAVQKSGSTNMSETLDGSKSLCNHSFGFKNRATISTEKAPTQKHEVPKKDSVAPEHYTNVCLLQESFRHSELDFVKKNVSETCKLKLNEINVKKSSGLYESAQSQKMHDVKCHRRRSSSTCLVAVSKTKLVRKRKADINHTNTENSKVFPVQKKLKLLQPVNRYKLNKIGTLKVKNLIPNAYSVNNNPFSMVKLKPSAKAFHVKASCNRDKFKLVRLKPSVSSSGLSKFRLIVDQKKMKKAHCPVENVTLLESKLPSKSKGKNVIIKSKHFIVKNGFESATDIQGKKGIQLTKDGKNKWFSPVNTAMLMAKKTKLLRTSKFKNDISNKMRRTPPGSELMAVSRTKLIRKPISEIKRLQKLKTADCRHEIKLNPSVKLAHRVKNKYKFIKNVHAVRHIHLKQPQALQETPKMQRILKKRIASRILKKNCSLIKIGDSYYRASFNKLTRRTPGIARGNCGSIFKVQGRKYILHKGRQPLKYIRGTPLQLSKLKSSGGSIRSKIGTPNTPWSRLLQAKQRSIALLTNRLRKNNQPCLMFNRFGRCAGRDKGTCNKLHDPKNIAICKRFVQGCCENPSCLLSHNVGPEKMPTCHHFLAGNCVRENCPYLHVKLSKKAPVCLAFLQGYCADAANCYKRHEHICPEFEEKGVCPKGKYCPYPHPKEKNSHCRSSEQSRSSTDVCVKNSVEAKNSVEEDEEEIKNVVSSCRYFEEATADEFSLAECCEESVVEESTICTNDESPNYWINSRPKIGDLPGYIPLMNNSLDKIT